ncbi:peptidoglycan DD-metalloendopeptidase family protein [Phenylobacterium sp.]|uniref:murein hydrolase activator EnvC family protein n=2 Tax=Phenylobacterium sp. TaxID=1871053 RepID=UPI00396C65B9
MTHFPTRPILILLAASALTACATPNFPIEPPVIQPPPPAARPQTPPPAAARVEEPPPEAPRAAAPVESRPLDAPLPAARPPEARPEAPPPAVQAPPPAPVYKTVTTRSVTGKVVDVDGPPKIYEVKSGDNLERIAKKLDTTVEQLKKDNKLKSDVIRPGQELKGPSSDARAYVVGSGDTLYAISRRFGVSASAIAEENELTLSSTLRPGQRLRLPDGFKDKGPIVTTERVQVEAPPPPVQRPAPVSTPAPVRTAEASPPPTPVRTEPPAPRAEEPPPRLPSQPQPYTGRAQPPPAPARTAPPPAQAAPQVASRPTPPPSGPTPTITGAPVASAPPSDAQVSQMGRGRFVWPVRGDILSGFGPKGPSQRNDGVNIRASTGDPVRAAAAGDVVYAGDQVPGFGNLVLIKHADGWVTAYGHLARVDVKMQQKVTQGQQIGQVGSTGGVTEPQLHFEVRYAPNPEERARPIDPALVLPR